MKKFLLILGMWLAMMGVAFAQININTATKDQLESLKGIGPGKAQAIIDYRTKNGPFKTVDDLEKVNRRRKSVGLNSLEEQTAIIRKQVAAENQKSPADLKERNKQADEWRKKVGWIK